MPISPHLPQMLFGNDDEEFVMIIFGFIASCIGCLFVLLINFFKLIFKQINKEF